MENKKMDKAVFLDRDGVLIKLIDRGARGKTPPWNEQELEFFPGIMEFLQKLKENNFKLFVVSNQPDVVSGEMDRNFLTYIDSILYSIYKVDFVFSAQDRGSKYYKPNPWMIKELVNSYQIDLLPSWMIGDTWRDAVCARLSKIGYIHIGHEDPIAKCDYKVFDLPTAVDIILDNDIF
jgi:D-glycero-D-manno-heptose 1,7-bisphosphate phosphatase